MLQQESSSLGSDNIEETIEDNMQDNIEMPDSSSRTIIPAMIWLFITLFYCYQYVLRLLPNIIMPEIISKYNISASEFGSFAGIYYIGYIVVHLPIGVLLTRKGSKVVLPICICISAGGIGMLIYFESWHSALFGRMLTGIGSSAAIIGALQIFKILYPRKFTIMLGLTVSLSLITTVYISRPLAGIIDSIGLKYTINILLYSGLGLAFVTYILLPAKNYDKTKEDSVLETLTATAGNYKLILTSICAGLMVGPLEGFADAWGSAFLISVYELAKTVADANALLIILGMCIGCIILPYLADKTRLYFTITVIAALMMAGCFIYLLTGKVSKNNIQYICLLIGIFCAYQVIIIAKISTFVSEEKSSTAAAIANMIIMAFGWVFHNSIGRTLDYFWQGEMVAGVKIYSAHSFIKTITIIPAAMILAAIGLTIIAFKIRMAIGQQDKVH